ncbi:MAG TPA: hypothetical protein VLM38_14770, partial [Blastocatellia bacterium]|nr:hypothetical protein [Blastocatellia bacterium]
NSFNAGNNPAQLGSMTFEEIKNSLGVFKTGFGVFFIDPKLLDIDTTGGVLRSARLKPGILTTPAVGTFGNFPLNSLWGPNFTQTDITVVKRTSFSERGNVEFRVIAFNIFNHANFSYGGDTFDGANFGRITGFASGTTSRQISGSIGINW